MSGAAAIAKHRASSTPLFLMTSPESCAQCYRRAAQNVHKTSIKRRYLGEVDPKQGNIESDTSKKQGNLSM